MAIKGKKKSQHRGAQARRRPAAAPRPAPSRSRPPWYRTDRGRAVAAGVVAIAIALGGWAIADAQSESRSLQRRRDAMEAFTSRALALLQEVRPAVQEMAQFPGAAAPGDEVGDLRSRARSWVEALERARARTGERVEAASAVNSNRLFAQALSIYTSAARTYLLVPEAPPALRSDLLERAAASRDDGGAVWLAAAQVLDAERQRLQLPASGLQPPSVPPPGGAPAQPAPEVGSEDAGNGAGGSGGQGGGGSGGGGGQD